MTAASSLNSSKRGRPVARLSSSRWKSSGCWWLFTHRLTNGIKLEDKDDTKKRIREAKFYLGYTGAELKTVAVDETFMRRLRHPRSARASSFSSGSRAEQGIRRGALWERARC